MPTTLRSPRTARLAAIVAAMLASATTLARPAHAAVVSITDANQATAVNAGIPPVVRSNPADSVLRAWDEVVEFTLTKRLRVDRLASTGERGFLAAGTVLNSHLIQWDGPSFNPPTDHATADINFDGEIVAIILKTKTLRQSNFLRRPGLTHQRFRYHGLERRHDTVLFGDDMMSVVIDWLAGRPGDWIRVITAPAVPAPPTGDDDDDDDDDDTPPTGDDDDDDDTTPPTGDDDDDDDHTPPVSAPAPGALPAGLVLLGAATLRRRRRR